ncbi:MAG: TetR/AcrR family transcriptional regulator [Pseudomonadota bacterium]
MNKADDRRAAILERLTDHVLAEGLAGASLRPLAKAAGTSDRMLIYYFKDKSALVAAILQRVGERLALLLQNRMASEPMPFEALRAALLEIILDDALWPYMRVWLEVASMAAGGDPVCRAVGEQLARGFLAWGEAQLDSASPEARNAEAAALLLTIDGAIFLKSVGVDDIPRRLL